MASFSCKYLLELWHRGRGAFGLLAPLGLAELLQGFGRGSETSAWRGRAVGNKGNLQQSWKCLSTWGKASCAGLVGAQKHSPWVPQTQLAGGAPLWGSWCVFCPFCPTSHVGGGLAESREAAG